MVYFIGAGPGDPELLTLKAKRIIDSADVIIYAGSLVNPAVLADRKADAQVYDSAVCHLDEILDIMITAVRQGQLVARVHTGDPSIYGAIREQIDRLKACDIPYEVIPGVSSFLAAAATLSMEYTLPEVSQTIILTRANGRTPVPEKEGLMQLAKHQASLVIFLSVQQIDQVVRDLLAGGYGSQTPAAVVSRATWPDELVIRGCLADIAERVKAAGIRRHALILVGDFLGDRYALSKLYDAGFTHGYRKGKNT